MSVELMEPEADTSFAAPMAMLAEPERHEVAAAEHEGLGVAGTLPGELAEPEAEVPTDGD